MKGKEALNLLSYKKKVVNLSYFGFIFEVCKTNLFNHREDLSECCSQHQSLMHFRTQSTWTPF